MTTPKAPAEETGKKTPASKTKKTPAKKGKAAPAASDEGDSADAKEAEKPIDPEELRKKKEKESTQSPIIPSEAHPDRSYLAVLFLRHKLQKGFISRDQPPKEDEMASMASYFDKLEKHSDLEVSIIRSTKINKVLKMIVKLNSIPRDEEFNFRHRAMNILSNWKNILDADTPGPVDKDEEKPAVNGSKEEDGVETPKVETEEEKEPEAKTDKEDVDSPMPDADEKAPEPEKEDVADNEKPAEKPTETEGKPAEEEKAAEEPSKEKSVEAAA